MQDSTTATSAVSQPASGALPAELVKGRRAELHPWLARIARDSDDRVVLDAASVTAVDAGGIELLLSFHATLLARGGALVLAPCTAVLREALALVGAADLAAGSEAAR